MASEASMQIIELVKQWSEQSSLSTDKFDLQALRAAMSSTQIPLPEDAKFEKIDIVLTKSLKVGTTIEINPL